MMSQKGSRPRRSFGRRSGIVRRLRSAESSAVVIDAAEDARYHETTRSPSSIITTLSTCTATRRSWLERLQQECPVGPTESICGVLYSVGLTRGGNAENKQVCTPEMLAFCTARRSHSVTRCGTWLVSWFYQSTVANSLAPA